MMKTIVRTALVALPLVGFAMSGAASNPTVSASAICPDGMECCCTPGCCDEATICCPDGASATVSAPAVSDASTPMQISLAAVAAASTAQAAGSACGPCPEVCSD